MYAKTIILSTLIFCLTISCTISPDFPPEPHLEFKGMNKKIMKQGSLNTDSLTIYLSFTDGDGDIGQDQTDSIVNLFVIDSRTNKTAESIRLPKISDSGIGNGVSGDIELKLYTTCCLFTNNIPPCSVIEGIKFDTLTYRIYLVDRAGNKSEIVETDNIILECK
ncbi:MAG: hypothetical protein ACM3PT_06630 [Deltaproteobacteria bacterium]